MDDDDEDDYENWINLTIFLLYLLDQSSFSD